MLANNIWRLLGELFEKILFIPYDFFRLSTGEDNWWSSNLMNFIFLFIFFIMMGYWTKLMISYKKAGKEDEA